MRIHRESEAGITNPVFAPALQALRGDEAEVVAAWQRREAEIGQLQQQAAVQDQRVAAAEASVVDKKVCIAVGGRWRDEAAGARKAWRRGGGAVSFSNNTYTCLQQL